MPESASRSFLLASAEETIALGRSLGAALEGGETIALAGELGSGKTTFTKGLCSGLGVADSRIVSSPTYVLEHVYEARFPIHHFDAYRLSSVEELVALGFQEHFRTGSVLVVEWAEKVARVLPPERLLVELSIPAEQPLGSHRRVILSGPHAVWASKLERIKVSRAEGR
jgi:tRNA threonylcarbamoyl adenosine modification protein YjeE